MNLYILVEGKRTEKKVYPAWLGHLTPQLTRVDRFNAVIANNYFIFSGEGYPSLLDVHLPNAIADFNSIDKYTTFVIALDVDDSTPELRISEVVERATSHGLNENQLRVIPQNCCIESWFLGNPQVISASPRSPRLAEFLRHCNVRSEDPELMPKMNGFSTRAMFHHDYLRKIAEDKNFRYSKRNPGHVTSLEYVRQLENRITDSKQMKTLSVFFSLCEEINNNMT